MQFEWAQAEVVNVAKGRTWRMSIPDGTLDKLSYMLALMNDLQDGKRELIYPVADGGQLKTYRVEGLGHQQLDTALGTLDTLMVRRTREGSPRQTTYWCAPALDYLPVQVEHRERDGSIITLRISAATGFDGLEKSP